MQEGSIQLFAAATCFLWLSYSDKTENLGAVSRLNLARSGFFTIPLFETTAPQTQIYAICPKMDMLRQQIAESYLLAQQLNAAMVSKRSNTSEI